MITEQLDVRKKVCPMPVLLTKRKLEKVDAGKIIEVIGDYHPAMDNIQRWARDAGHEIIDVIQCRSEFKIKIKKH
jgi:tRNA 2-thiouridine synthesizing protein A